MHHSHMMVAASTRSKQVNLLELHFRPSENFSRKLVMGLDLNSPSYRCALDSSPLQMANNDG